MAEEPTLASDREHISADGVAAKGGGGAPASKPIAITSPTSPPSGNFEIPRYFTFNETGNIMLSSTEPNGKNMNQASIDEFNEVAVFFAAMTKSMEDAGCQDLYDYKALDQIVNGSGLFVHVYEQDFKFTQSSASVTFNTDLVAALLGIAATDGADILIAQTVLAGMGKSATVGGSHMKSSDKVGHLLFVCEYLMGMPLVTAQFYYVDKSVAASAWSAGACLHGKTYHESIEIHRDSFMFVPPKFIKEYSKDLVQAHDEKAFGQLVKYLEGLIKKGATPPPHHK